MFVNGLTCSVFMFFELENWNVDEISKSKWVYSLVKQLRWMRLFIAQGDE